MIKNYYQSFIHSPTDALVRCLKKTILKFTLKQLRHVSVLQLHHHQGAHYFALTKATVVKLDWSVYTCLTQLYDGRDMNRIYYTKNYMFRHFTLAIFRLINEKT